MAETTTCCDGLNPGRARLVKNCELLNNGRGNPLFYSFFLRGAEAPVRGLMLIYLRYESDLLTEEPILIIIIIIVWIKQRNMYAVNEMDDS